ncbi:hypothetical protein KQ51_00656 [Candidatus Izimaplasma bacterium HR1]|uniref:hypothetical protein n=1 Tax=Candidatus Izimoplasma sp. HR1 TaxID=1541959 RepID=UPI0004F6A463|nr:hypothetical protein KQ51_00656 [Candidatus Izimaplasma bacterium HR1]
MNKYLKFWEWFLSRSEYIYAQLETNVDDIALEITEHVKKVHEDIEFEIPFELVKEKRILILSADGDEVLFPIVEELVESAPVIPTWDIVAFRPRLHQKNQIIDLDGITMDYFDIYFKWEIDNNQLILDVYIKNFDGSDNRYVHLYFLLLDSLIGEYDSVKIIKETRIYPLVEKTNDLIQFPKLLGIVDELIKQR